VREGNNEVGGRLLEFGGTEYMIRGRGYAQSLEDFQNIVLQASEDGTTIRIKDVGEVVEVKSGSATQTQLIHVRPGAGLERLKEVAVLLYHPPPRSESDQSLPNVEKKVGGRQ